MKTIAILILGLSLHPCLFAQTDSSGVYQTAKDFENRKLIYPCDCKSLKCAVIVASLFNSNKFAVTHDGKKHKLKKSEFFGYRTCDKKAFRFFNNLEYQILNSKRIYLYDRMQESGTGMNPDIENLYFFSLETGSQILPLTIDNLKSSFPKNTKFHDSLDAFFKGDSELIGYDKYLKQYRLVHYFDESLK